MLNFPEYSNLPLSVQNVAKLSRFARPETEASDCFFFVLRGGNTSVLKHIMNSNHCNLMSVLYQSLHTQINNHNHQLTYLNI